ALAQIGPERLPLPQAMERAQAMLVPEASGAEAVYPVDALGPLADAARDLAAGAQVDVAMAGQSLLAAAALVTQSVGSVRSLDGAMKPLALYAMTIANSGDGKDSGDRVALQPVHAFQRAAGKAYLRALAQAAAEKSARKKGDAPGEAAARGAVSTLC
ncbi:hypothetical protein B2A_13061, partial [mine drainage metagenome]